MPRRDSNTERYSVACLGDDLGEMGEMVEMGELGRGEKSSHLQTCDLASRLAVGPVVATARDLVGDAS